MVSEGKRSLTTTKAEKKKKLVEWRKHMHKNLSVNGKMVSDFYAVGCFWVKTALGEEGNEVSAASVSHVCSYVARISSRNLDFFWNKISGKKNFSLHFSEEGGGDECPFTPPDCAIACLTVRLWRYDFTTNFKPKISFILKNILWSELETSRCLDSRETHKFFIVC